MSVTPHLPDDPGECQRLLDDLLRRNNELRQQAESAQQHAESAQQQVEDAQRRIDELERVLDQTAAEYDQLKEKHTELAETLALLRRYVFGQRRERFTDDPGQGHLFDIPEIIAEPEPAAPTSPDDVVEPPGGDYRRQMTWRISGRRPLALRREPGSIISPTPGSRTMCPKTRKPAPAAGAPKHASAKTSPANSISSRRGSR
jgi:ABC-type transporter Mla subunit MlaD